MPARRRVTGRKTPKRRVARRKVVKTPKRRVTKRVTRRRISPKRKAQIARLIKKLSPETRARLRAIASNVAM